MDDPVLATSVAQRRAARLRQPAPPELVRSDVLAFGVSMEGYLGASLAYALLSRDGGVHIIDPGWDLEDNWSRLGAALAMVGRGVDDIATVIATHHHHDHLGLAARIQSETGAIVVLPGREIEALRNEMGTDAFVAIAERALDTWGVPPQKRWETLARLRRVPSSTVPGDMRDLDDAGGWSTPDFGLEVVPTPGHTVGHVCVADRGRGIVFTGDHILPTANPGLAAIAAPDIYETYRTSLARTARLDDLEALPGHGYRFRGVARRGAAIAEHHRLRKQEVASAAMGRTGMSTWEVASRVRWSAGWDALSGTFLYSALAQTQHYLDSLHARSDLDGHPLSPTATG